MIKYPMGSAQLALLDQALTETQHYNKVRCETHAKRLAAERLARRGYLVRRTYTYFEMTPEGIAEAYRCRARRIEKRAQEIYSEL